MGNFFVNFQPQVIMQAKSKIVPCRWFWRSSMKKCIIIGASSGIGKELARILAKDHYILGLAARRVELLHQLQEELDTDTYVKYIDISRPDEAMSRLSELIVEMKD